MQSYCVAGEENRGARSPLGHIETYQKRCGVSGQGKRMSQKTSQEGRHYLEGGRIAACISEEQEN